MNVKQSVFLEVIPSKSRSSSGNGLKVVKLVNCVGPALGQLINNHQAQCLIDAGTTVTITGKK